MPITDGWMNIFRLDAHEAVQRPNEDLRVVHDLFGGAGPESWLATTVDDALAVMDATGTERALVAVGDGRPRHHPTTAMLLPVSKGLEACRRAPDRFRLVLHVHDVTAPHQAARRVREVGAHEEVVAVGVMASLLGCDLTDRRLYPVYDACVDMGLALRLNLGIAGPAMPSRHQHPELLEDLLIDFPELTVIGCHMGHPYETLLIRLMLKFPNLSLMTSGFSPRRFDPAIVRFMDSSRGRGRILFGSDHPGIPLPRMLDAARELPIGSEALDQFLGDALCDVLGWH